ncbi:hypothetical protein TrRE_jg3027 [Triparma retinervis]|uniref:Uncharacterized protein n=1 Tax=Triparma retinervis TaxID=2557542 RepID=A0A9W7ANE7_9STRA|nr:hypothetical protein TrRE_jg3027 [Triparma retinervis]
MDLMKQNPTNPITSLSTSTAPKLPPLKCMLFIDGTWLYYSLYQRQSSPGKAPENPLQDAFGTAWTLTHGISWDKLPGIIAKSLSEQFHPTKFHP